MGEMDFQHHPFDSRCFCYAEHDLFDRYAAPGTLEVMFPDLHSKRKSFEFSLALEAGGFGAFWLFVYSVLKASTGFFLEAMEAGTSPAIMVRIKLITTRMTPPCHGRTAILATSVRF